ncbi:pupal cuticle protein Edg-91-like isoform X2 [Zootermopsis nevadensis]|uniref:pupal cuticle protein Edg-91-like isoform X2 n=1 Tax=Zootermopsis nevadensis TaxID=136037 RepID=UPI000B8E8ABA|nr:pupal cuticle protein Edg-91-like isoform X2 [Zootermopsis nevadensis]
MYDAKPTYIYMEASYNPYHRVRSNTMRHHLAVILVLPLVASVLLHAEVKGASTSESTNKQTAESKNSKFNFGYNSNGVNPGSVVYTLGGYYPGGSGYYPAGANGGYPGYPGAAETRPNPCGDEDEGPVSGADGGKIPGGVPVDNEVEVFNVPQSNQGGYPGRGEYPNGGYPSGGYPGYYPGVYTG